jgi:ribosomal protein L4
VISADKLTTYDILNADTLILAEGAVEKIEKLFND